MSSCDCAGMASCGGQVSQMNLGIEGAEQRDTASQEHRRAGEHDVIDQAAAEPVRNDLAAVDIDRCRGSLSEQRQRFVGGCRHGDSRVVGRQRATEDDDLLLRVGPEAEGQDLLVRPAAHDEMINTGQVLLVPRDHRGIRGRLRVSGD